MGAARAKLGSAAEGALARVSAPMCGRYGYSKRALSKIAQKLDMELDAAMRVLLDQYRQQNHAPTMLGPVVRLRPAGRGGDAAFPEAGRSDRAPAGQGGAPLAAGGAALAGRPVAELLRWGFAGLPWPGGGPAPLHINARCETVARLPAFRDSWAHRRCLVVADCFYEWDQQTRPKQPWRFARQDEEPLVMAGLWKPTALPNGQTVDAYAIVTTAANTTVGRLHDRMPVLLAEEDWRAWLDPATPPPRLLALHRPYDGPMAARPVDPRLNKASYEGEVAEVSLPTPPPQQQQLSL